MALTKVQNTGIADDAVTTDKIENSTVLAADIAPGTITNAKLSNSALTINGSSISLGGSGSAKHIEWQAITVADGSTTLTAEAGKGYFLDTNVGVIEVFLPSSPTRGDTIVLSDYSGTFATNQCIINTGGQLIDSTAGPDFKVTTNNSIVELVYVDSNKGWLVKLNQAAGTTPSSALGVLGDYDTNPANFPFITATGGTVTESGDFKIHTFTGDGNFVVSWAGQSPAPSKVDYLVVAGGGAGGGTAGECQVGGGGGGAGGYRTTFPRPGCNAGAFSITATTFPITVGGGGAGSATPHLGANGSNSVFSTITSTGGGKGGAEGDTNESDNSGGSPGGSGGGGSYEGPGGSGNTPPVSPSQGNDGGDPQYSGGPTAVAAGGGGGGANAAGADATPTAAGAGGAGTPSTINGSDVTRGGGGGGSTFNNNGTVGGGGAGGGGAGVKNNAPPSNSGTANTGGGGGATGGKAGGGGNSFAGGSGGKGIVIIRYKFQ